LSRRHPTHRKLRDGWGTRAFVFQEPSLAFHAAAIAGEVACCANNSMTRDDDGNWVVMIRLANSAEGIRAADGAGDICIRAGLTVGNV